MIKIKRLLFLIILIIPTIIYSQIDTSWSSVPTFHFEGFLDVYYVYNFNNPQGEQRRNFFFNHNRHNEFNVNLGYVKASLDHSRYRASLALQTGTYAQDNYAAEDGVLRNLYEAYAGIALTKKKNLWLDAGIFSSHLGFESPVSMDDPTLTRSLVAESSPFFLAGAKLTYTCNDNWEFTGIITNGWQRIERVEGNSFPSFGTQIVFKPTSKTLLNWSTFIGTDDPDETRRMRYFSDIYGIFTLSDKFNLWAGFDIGFQQESKGSPDFDSWLGGVLILQYHFSDHWSTSGRFEYYEDPSQVIIPTTSGFGFRTSGISWNLDFVPVDILACRLETRWLTSPDEVFEKGEGEFVSNDIFIAASIAVRLKSQ